MTNYELTETISTIIPAFIAVHRTLIIMNSFFHHPFPLPSACPFIACGPSSDKGTKPHTYRNGSLEDPVFLGLRQLFINQTLGQVGKTIRWTSLAQLQSTSPAGCSSNTVSSWQLGSAIPASSVFPMAQRVKNPPAMQETQETQVQFLGQEDPWRRKWQPTPVFLPGESHGERSLAGYSPWGHNESDTT